MDNSSTPFETRQLPAAVDAIAPDGSDVRILLHLPAGGMAHFSVVPRGVSVTIQHRTISEIWYFLSGRGQLWRRHGDQDQKGETVDVRPGTTITIPVGTAFQFRSTTDEPLTAVGVTMPPWPGDGETIFVSDGPWTATLEPGPA